MRSILVLRRSNGFTLGVAFQCISWPVIYVSQVNISPEILKGIEIYLDCELDLGTYMYVASAKPELS